MSTKLTSAKTKINCKMYTIIPSIDAITNIQSGPQVTLTIISFTPVYQLPTTRLSTTKLPPTNSPTTHSPTITNKGPQTPIGEIKNMYYPKRTSKVCRNQYSKNGIYKRCNICQSMNHWAQNYPVNKSEHNKYVVTKLYCTKLTMIAYKN